MVAAVILEAKKMHAQLPAQVQPQNLNWRLG